MRVAVGCVTEQSNKYLAQALRLLQSWRWFAGALADSEFYICVIDGVPRSYRKLYERYGAHVRVVSRFSKAHPPSNKLRFLELASLADAERVILLDCDTVIVQEPLGLVSEKDFAAKIADSPTVPLEIFRALFSFFKLPTPKATEHCTVRGEPTLPYFNAGVLSFSRNAMAALIPEWLRLNLALSKRLDLLKDCTNFCEQASLSLALASCGVSFEALGNRYNFPVHFCTEPLGSDFAKTDPVIVHYHDLIDKKGLLQNSCYPAVNERIQSFNERLTQERQGGGDGEGFWERLRAVYRPVKKFQLSRPIFLIGAMRSGTTLLANFLGNSPHIAYCPFELKDIWSRHGGIPMASPKTRDTECPECDGTEMTSEMKGRLKKAFLARMGSLQGKIPTAVFLNKNPHLCNKLFLVKALFPDARYIWVRRHLPQVVASMKRLFADVQARQLTWHGWPRPSAKVGNRCWNAYYSADAFSDMPRERIFPGGNIRYLAEYWLESNRAVADFFSASSSSDRIVVSYENFLASPTSELVRVRKSLGIPLQADTDNWVRLDKHRNDEWRSLLSREDRDELFRFVETMGAEINMIFGKEDLASIFLQMLKC